MKVSFSCNYAYYISFSIYSFTDKFLSAQGIPCLRVKGSIYHNIGSIFPFENNKPKFLQIFFHANEEDIDLRSLADNEKQLLHEIRLEIKRINPFIQVLNDILFTTGALRNPNAIQNFKITLSNEPDRNDHPGRYQLPTSTCVSAIIIGNEDSTIRRRREVVIHLRSRYPEKVSCLHSSYDPLAYVLTHTRRRWMDIRKICRKQFWINSHEILQLQSAPKRLCKWTYCRRCSILRW